MRKRIGLRRSVAVLTAVVAALVIAPLALAGGISSSTNPAVDNPTGTLTLCNNGGAGANTPPGATNCNIYTSKAYVWLSGLPLSASLDPGTYFYAVLDPGGQRDPNDGSVGNLSDDVDAWTNREFTINSSGTLALANSSTHDLANNKIRVGLSPNWFADTDNHGDVYILAVCAVPDPVTDSPGAKPQDCKYDAFKVSETSTTPPATDLVVTKDATPAWAEDIEWTAAKQQTTSSTSIDAIGASVTVAYKVQATWSVASDTYSVSGAIHVNNPNSYDVTGVGVTDKIYSDSTTATVDTNAGTNGSCTVSDGSYTVSGNTTTGISHTNGTIPAGVTVDFPYSCSYTGTPTGTEYNRAHVTWDASNALPDTSADSDYVDFTWPSAPTSTTNACTTVSDTWSSTSTTTTLGTVCTDGLLSSTSNVYNGNSPLTGFALAYTSTNPARTWTFTYSRSVPVTAGRCVTYDNTATVTDDETGSGDDDSVVDDDSASASVTVCGPAATGALTIGFWKTTNGNSLISNYCTPAGKTTLANYLANVIPTGSAAGTGSGPFAGAYGKSCSQLVTYVNGILSGANASNMNVMLKAQMLGTALDVYFSTSSYGWTTSSSGKIKPPSSFFNSGTTLSPAAPNLGSFNMDLTAICPMVDNTSGSATCSGGKPSTNGVTSGAFDTNCKTIDALLHYEAIAPQWALVSGADVWYAGNKTKENVAKNAFDQFNNQDAFSC